GARGMTGSDSTLVAILAVVEQVAGPRRIPPDVGPETRFSEGGFWLDSVELLQVVVACEERFAIVFGATQDLTGGSPETPATLTALVRSKRPRITGDAGRRQLVPGTMAGSHRACFTRRPA